MDVLVHSNDGKFQISGFPRSVGPTPGHLSECLLVMVAEAAQEWGDPWPPLGKNVAYCTCDDWSPDE